MTVLGVARCRDNSGLRVPEALKAWYSSTLTLWSADNRIIRRFLRRNFPGADGFRNFENYRQRVQVLCS